MTREKPLFVHIYNPVDELTCFACFLFFTRNFRFADQFTGRSSGNPPEPLYTFLRAPTPPTSSLLEARQSNASRVIGRLTPISN